MKNIIVNILTILIILILLYCFVQAVRLRKALEESKKRYKEYNATIVDLSYGKMEYLDRGQGEIILSNHGLFGGFDQAFENVIDFSKENRIIAPSRFGYLKSDVLGNGTPKEQAKAYIELLDKLKINKVFVMGASAGGTVAIRFALDYPERCKGLILYCSAIPEIEKPSNINLKQGPPDFMVGDYAMFILSPFFKTTIGMDPSIINSMLPINAKKLGIKLDSEVTNPDMAVNFEDYKIESLKVPTLILQSKDDKLIDINKTMEVSKRFPNLTLKIFETGGHMMQGNGEEIKATVNNFISKYK